MYEVVVDRNESLDPSEYNCGASFYFNSIAELSDFLDICFKSNANREYILIREVEDK